MKNKFYKLFIILITTLIIIAIISVFFGPKSLEVTQTLQALNHQADNLTNSIVLSRIIRVVAAIIIGMVLATSGVVLQSIFRNPLADSSLLGINQAALLGLVIATVISPGVFGSKILLGLSLCIIVCLVLILLLLKLRNQFSTILLIGIGFSMIFSSLASIIAIIGNKSYELSFWLGGGLGQVNLDSLKLLIFGSLPIIIVFFNANKLNIIGYGDDVATSLGLTPGKFKINMIICLMLPLTSVVLVGGNIAFVGLLIPHILRSRGFKDNRWLLPLSACLGAMLLVVTDLLARVIIAPYEVPLGAFITLMGVITLFFSLRKEAHENKA